MISPISKSRIITAICSLAKPLKISGGVRMPKIPRTIIPIRNVNAGPTISVYREMMMKASTIEMISISKSIPNV
jgi:hypothetical protein